jgi:8-oxo-dGTP pyrophosphatase MutT (NUDIX family)
VAEGQNPYLPYAGRSSIYAPPGMLQQGWSQVDYSYMVGLPRPLETFTSGDFSPLAPILPVPIDIPEPPAGRPRPRRWQVPVGFNLPVGQPGTEGIKLAAFQQLRDLAEIPSIGRVCIEIRKSDLLVAGNAGDDQGWDIVPTSLAQAEMQGNPKKRADFEKRKEEIIQFFHNPDPDNYDGFESWANALLEDSLVLDAVALHVHPAGGKGNGPVGSDVGALALIDGSTVKPLLDEWGARPSQPAPAYQQYLWSVPRVDLMDILNLGPEATIEDYKDLNPLMDQLAEQTDEWLGSEMVYFRQNPRSWTPYGFGPLEQAIMPITIMQARQQWQWEFFRSGSLPSVFLDPGESIATPEEARQLMQAINQLGGDLAAMHQVIVLPPGAKITEQKPVDLSSDFDTWQTGLICMPFGLAISDLGITPKLASMMSPMEGKMAAASAADRTTRRSALPLARKLATSLFNRLIHGKFGQDDMRWTWGIMEQGESRADKITQAVEMLKASTTTIDETRIAVDLDPLGESWSTIPLQFLPTGVIPMGQTPPQPGGGGSGPGQDEPPPHDGTAGGDYEIEPNKKPAALPPGESTKKPGEAAQTTASQGQEAAAQTDAAEPHDSAEEKTNTSAAKSLELRQLRRFLARGRPLSRFAPKVLRPAAVRAAAGEKDPARAALKAAQAQAHLDKRDIALVGLRRATGGAVQQNLAQVIAGAVSVGAFVDMTRATLADNYKQALEAGAIAAVAHFLATRPMDANLAQDLANAKADRMGPFLKDLALDAGALGSPGAPASYEQVMNRAQGYGDGLTGAYEQGLVASSPEPADGVNTVIVWHLGDADHCDNCIDLDGQMFSEQTLPGFPGDGGFGQSPLCQGGPRCACYLTFESGDEVLAQTQTPSVLRASTAFGEAPQWDTGYPMTESATLAAFHGGSRALKDEPATKDISLASPLGSGLVPFDLSGPGGRRAPNNVGERKVAETYVSGNGASAADTGRSQPLVAAGLAVRAADTGRVLMLQRALDDNDDLSLDPAGGRWEFPGGHLEDGEEPHEGAVREWQEEVGTRLPPLAGVAQHTSGPYRLHVAEVPHEGDVAINQGDGREVHNPDGDRFETAAWVHPHDLDGMPLRPELQRDLPTVLRAVTAPAMAKLKKRTDPFQHKGPLEHEVHDYLRQHYPEKSTGWVCKSAWEKSKIPLKAIAWTDRPGGRDEAKVASMAKRLKDGWKPDRVVLIDQGSAGKMQVADGYHRLAAMAKCGCKEARAFVGTPRPGAGDWKADIKAMQAEASNAPATKQGPHPELDEDMADLIARRLPPGWTATPPSGPKAPPGYQSSEDMPAVPWQLPVAEREYPDQQPYDPGLGGHRETAISTKDWQDQPRDSRGRWTTGAGDGGATSAAGAGSAATGQTIRDRVEVAHAAVATAQERVTAAGVAGEAAGAEMGAPSPELVAALAERNRAEAEEAAAMAERHVASEAEAGTFRRADPNAPVTAGALAKLMEHQAQYTQAEIDRLTQDNANLRKELEAVEKGYEKPGWKTTAKHVIELASGLAGVAVAVGTVYAPVTAALAGGVLGLPAVGKAMAGLFRAARGMRFIRR